MRADLINDFGRYDASALVEGWTSKKGKPRGNTELSKGIDHPTI
jgi:hypothetical protein